MPCGGAGVIASLYARYLSGTHDILFIYGGRTRREYSENGYRVVQLPVFRNTPPVYASMFNPHAYRLLQQEVDAFLPDLVFLHNMQNKSFSLLSLRISLQYPVVWMVHDLWHQCLWSFPRPYGCRKYRSGCLLCKKAPVLSIIARQYKDRMITCLPFVCVYPSQWLKTESMCSPLSEKAHRVLAYGIETGRFREQVPHVHEEIYSRWQIPVEKAACYVVFVGSTDSTRKGAPEAFSAFETVRAACPRLRFIGVGRRGSSMSLSEGMFWIEDAGHEDMKMIYQLADMVIFPSRADNLPLTVIESLAAGTPVISFATGGVREIIDDDHTGYIVSNVREMAEKIAYIYHNPSHAQILGARSRQRMQARFDVTGMISGFENTIIPLVVPGETKEGSWRASS